jgi:hypothetical protein
MCFGRTASCDQARDSELFCNQNLIEHFGEEESVPGCGACFLCMTTDNHNSLIRPDEEQLDLIPSDQLPDEIFRDAEAGTGDGYDHEFTAARLFSQKPETYLTIISLLAEGLGVIRIGRLLKVSPNTVLAVRDREGEIVDIEKERISSAARSAARMCVEGIIEDLSDSERRKKISARDKAIIHGVLVEKSELLSGGVTSRVEVKHAEPTHNDFNSYLESLPQVDVCEMDQPGEKGGQKTTTPIARFDRLLSASNDQTFESISEIKSDIPKQNGVHSFTDNRLDTPDAPFCPESDPNSAA